MRPFTNKVLLAVCVGIFLSACSAKEEPAKKVTPEETVVVEEPVLPPTAEKVQSPAQDLDAPQEPTAKTTVKPVENSAVKKTLYPNEAVINLKAWDKKLKFLKTHFEQTTQYDGVPVSKSQGTLFYDKDKNLLRLDTLNSDGKTDQTAVTDKQKILILDGQGQEITTLSWAEWQQGQPNQALFDFGNYTALLARHNAALKEPYVLELTPKEGEPYQLYLTLSKEDYFPTNIKIVSDLMVTEATLSDTQKNGKLPFDTFRAGGLFQ